MVEAERLFGAAARVGGALCLDFTNTVDWHASGHPGERLRTYDDLLLWAEYGGLVTSGQAERLRRMASGRPAEADAVLARARARREALYRLLMAGLDDARRTPEDLGEVNAWVRDALGHAALERAESGYAWGWLGQDDALDAVLWPVARSVAALLTGPALAKVRRCADEDCGWLFLDESRNGSRRWCSMASCGARAKMRDYYQRKRGGESRRPGAANA